jgi:hypothetical protein
MMSVVWCVKAPTSALLLGLPPMLAAPSLILLKRRTRLKNPVVLDVTKVW